MAGAATVRGIVLAGEVEKHYPAASSGDTAPKAGAADPELADSDKAVLQEAERDPDAEVADGIKPVDIRKSTGPMTTWGSYEPNTPTVWETRTRQATTAMAQIRVAERNPRDPNNSPNALRTQTASAPESSLASANR